MPLLGNPGVPKRQHKVRTRSLINSSTALQFCKYYRCCFLILRHKLVEWLFAIMSATYSYCINCESNIDLYGFMGSCDMVPLPPIPWRRQCGMPNPARTQVSAHVWPRAQGRAQGSGRAQARALRCLRQTSKKTPPGQNIIPYMLKCVVLHLLITFHRILQIWHPQQKWVSLPGPHRNSVQKDVLCSPPSFFSSRFLR